MSYARSASSLATPVLARDGFKLKSSSRSRSLTEHDLFGKPVPTFPDHALSASWSRSRSAPPTPSGPEASTDHCANLFRYFEAAAKERRIELVLPHRIELWTSPLPRECSTTELRQQALRPYHRPRRRISSAEGLESGAILATALMGAQAGFGGAPRAARTRRGRRPYAAEPGPLRDGLRFRALRSSVSTGQAISDTDRRRPGMTAASGHIKAAKRADRAP